MMDRFVVGFIRASLVWLGVGVLLGLLMTVWSPAVAYRPAHMHANLLGFVSMMIFGVAYHVIPRFTGRPLHSRTLPMLHLWVANAGLALLVVAWMTRLAAPWLAPVALPVGAVLSASGAGVFIYNLWRTLDGAAAPRPAPQPAIRPPVAAGRS
jgi:hypothetical protein